MGRPKKNQTTETVSSITELNQPAMTWSIESPEDRRQRFIQETSVKLLLAVVEHSGKAHADQVQISVDRATALADSLGMGGRKPQKKTTQLINLVKDMESEEDLD